MQVGERRVCKIGSLHDGYLADHCVQELPAMPGSAYLALAIEQAFATDSALPPCTVNDVVFDNILFLPDDNACVLGVDLIDGDNGSSKIVISNLAAEPVSDETVNATMTVELNGRSSSRAEGSKLDIASLQAASTTKLDKTVFYDALASRGNQYGPAFRCVENLWCREGAALASLQNQVTYTESRPDILHPTIMDAALQTISATHVPNGQQSYVVTGIATATFSGAKSTPKWVHAELIRDDREHSDQVIGRAVICDESGEIIAGLDGVTFRYLDYSSANASGQKTSATIAVAATFTAEPLEDTIDFWGRQLETPVQTSFAPYNQVFQQFLDPESMFAKNNSGLNVALVRFDDWLAGLNKFTRRLEPAERDRSMAGLERYQLPGELEIAHLNPYETEYVYKEIFVDRCYMKGGITLCDGDVVFDIGANIGLFSLFVANEVRDATVFSFEPSPPSYACLAANAAVYGSNATVVNCGISDRERIATFTHYENSSVFSSFRADEGRDQAAIRAIVTNMVRQSGGLEGDELERSVDELMDGRLESKSYQCELKPISQVMREFDVTKIDLLKIDAEGSELDVLNGIDDADWDKILQVAIEVHDRDGPLVEAVSTRLRDHGFELEIVEEELLHQSGLYNIFAVRPGERQRSAHDAEDPIEETISRNITDLCRAIESAADRNQAPTLLMTCPPGPFARFDFARAQKQLGKAVEHIAQCHFLPYTHWSSLYPVAQLDDAEADRLGHIPYTPQFFTALGTAISRHFAATTRAPYKVIVLDCDNTLWRGVCGEDGPDGITVDEPYQQLQEFAVRQAESGMLLALSSKNVEDDVAAVFRDRADMPLKMEHIVTSRINWQPKSLNIQSIAEELNLGLDSFVFIDDNPVECAEVQAAYPEVLTLQLPTDPVEIPTFLDHVWAFDRAKVTTEDLDRSNYYRREKQREAFRENASTLKDFIDGLELEIDISGPDESRIPRISQLTQRTNQFNCTTIRRSEKEIREFIADESAGCLAVSLRDRFGDYGLVGVILYRCQPSKLEVDTFLLSCRVLGRGVEYEILNRLGATAVENGLEAVEVPFVPTAKNEPAASFLERAAGAFAHTRDESRTLYRIPAESCAAICYEPNSVVQETPKSSTSVPKSTGRRVASDSIVHVATGLNNVEHIIAAMSAARKSSHANPDVVLEGSELEQSIANIWREVLGLDRIGSNDRYTELGGTSLRAVQIVARMKRECGINMSLVDLYEHPTVAALAARFGSAGSEEADKRDAEAGRQRGERRKQRLAGRRSRRSSAVSACE